MKLAWFLPHCTVWLLATYTCCKLWWLLLLDLLLILAHCTTLHLCNILYCLPVQQRIIFKIALFNCIRDTGPAYFNDVCMPLSDIPGPSSLQITNRGDLLVPSTETKLGDRSFCIAELQYWIHCPFICMFKLSMNDNFKQGWNWKPF